MGIDLTIAPNRWGGMADNIIKSWLCHTRIDFVRNYSLFKQIGGFDNRNINPRVKTYPVADDFRVSWYTDEGVKKITGDAYGSKLTYTTAGELSKLRICETGDWNRAVISMIRALPPETQILLYWH